MNGHMNLDPNENAMSTAGAIGRGSVGVLASASGFVASSLPQIEAWLRVTSLIVGIGVGVATICNLVQARRPRK